MEVCSSGSRESGGRGGEAAGLGPTRGRPRGRGRGRGAAGEREPRIMSGFVFLRARGSLRMMLIFFPPQLAEKRNRDSVGGERGEERRGSGGGGETRGGRASGACGRKRRLGARGAAREPAAGLLHRPAAHSALGPGPPRSIAPRHWRVPA
ncbi:unnamed protein product [Nyctereutes procyonoides]|uniref:(raccoon dog) hypothetical protein n=1 Tax=Nyctereutes procyonoides TaxID=34880 RepID=A0A811ZKV5_NYCPR|nr:unnamed protein product [Nyctereutes procyonoides]